ncbi:MAG: GTP cyclohydrolase I FolE [Bdellovibrionaceae bacterium]|nr:GTP cyclohydrolase I FolE [Pseudobdellovibrionaceae bacterium]MDW8190859.1 GTP cyclohydrolase I FolE [Pseudobdellovibrionaceae bacterium]
MEEKRPSLSMAHDWEKILSTVTPTPLSHNGLSRNEKITRIAHYMEQILITLGLDLSDDSLKDSPKRIAKMYVDQLFTGLAAENFPQISVIENKMNYDQMVIVKDIRVMSICEHHFLPIHGVATVAYIPNKKVIGLSKINRIVDFFARRPQVQERLTKQIADCLEALLETKDVAVHVDARHYCVIARGIEDSQSTTVTSDLRGSFKTVLHTRNEFLAVTHKKNF